MEDVHLLAIPHQSNLEKYNNSVDSNEVKTPQDIELHIEKYNDLISINETKKPRDTESSHEVKITFKGESIMANVENDINSHGTAPKVTANLSLAKSVRKNIERASKNLGKDAHRLMCLDWALFGFTAICLFFITMRINRYFNSELDLPQVLGGIALASKSLEKKFDFGGRAKVKYQQIKELKRLIRKVSNIELTFYLAIENEDVLSRTKIAAEIHEIWEGFNEIELRIAITPSRLEQNINA
jgi:hypothetical protein